MILFVVLGLIVFWVCLKKFNFDFKGIELIVFWVLFTIFTYFNFGYDGLLPQMLDIPLIFLALYYLIRLFKTQKYIKWYLLIMQLIISVISLICFTQYENAVSEGWSMGSLILYIIFIGIFIYMIIINLITLIINKVKRS